MSRVRTRKAVADRRGVASSGWRWWSPARALVGLVVSLAAGCAPPADAPEPAWTPRHVVLVVIDSLRADHVGAHGYQPPTTPHLDALARQGVVYQRAYAASSARGQSLSALWTGRLPSSGGAVGLAEAVPHEQLLSLPRLALRAGWRTGLVSNDPTLRERTFTRGLDDIEVDSTPGRWTAGLVTEKALDMLDAAGEAHLFLTVDYADASEPHLPLREYRERFAAPVPEQPLSLPALRRLARDGLPDGIRSSPAMADLIARYDAEIAYVDDCLGALVDGLSGRGLLDDTLLIVTASHGTEFLEHGYVGSAWTLYDELLHVPLVVHGCGLAPGSVSEPVSLVDVLPTLIEVCDLFPEDLVLDGQALLAAENRGLVTRTQPGAVRAELIIPELVILRTAIRDETKLIEVVKDAPPAHRADLEAGYDELIAAMLDGTLPRPDLWAQPERCELYDLSVDPSERHDLGSSVPDRLVGLIDALAAYADHCRRSAPLPRHAARRLEPPDPIAAEALQQLGYL